MTKDDVLHIAEILYESGAIKFRYARRMSEDGTRWIRHGPFVAYHEDGGIASEGQYVDGAEEGLWRDYHENGTLAAEGEYRSAKEHGEWQFWNADGTVEKKINYADGVAQ